MPDRLREDLPLFLRGRSVRYQFGGAFNDLRDQVIKVDRIIVLQAGSDKLIDLAMYARSRNACSSRATCSSVSASCLSKAALRPSDCGTGTGRSL
jgi:hypothetical protein